MPQRAVSGSEWPSPAPLNSANWREISRPARALGAQSRHPRRQGDGDTGIAVVDLEPPEPAIGRLPTPSVHMSGFPATLPNDLS